MERKYVHTAAQLIDRLAIISLKSIKISENKEAYEKEASLIMEDLDSIYGPGQGKFIRAVQINGMINEIIWANESKARKGEDQDLILLKLTHSLNRVRNEAMNKISNLSGETQDLKSDYMDAEFTKQFGYDFTGVLQ